MASIPPGKVNNPSIRSNSDSFRSTTSTGSTLSTAASSTTSSRMSNLTPTSKRSCNLQSATSTTTPSARSSAATVSSMGRVSVQSNPNSNAATPRTMTARSNTSNNTLQPRSRFNSVNSINSTTSNSNPFTPSGRKLMSNPSSTSTSNNNNTRTTQRIKLQQEKVAAANANNQLRKSPSKNNHILSKSISTKNLGVGGKSKSSAVGKSLESWSGNEPIKAFLRVRPASQDGRKEHLDQHLEVISQTEVILSPTESYLRSTGRSTLPTKYSFTKVFTSDPSSSSTDGSDPNSQSSFFKDTTLPMIKDLLDGRSGLVCTYGVTNSGKSYTVQGERGDGKEGILPRAIDTVFNSISGLESESEIRPTGLYGVERYSPEESPIETSGGGPSQGFSIQSIMGRITSVISSSPSPINKTSSPQDSTTLQVDRNRRYSVWVSYVELYNEKFYDLLDVGTDSNVINNHKSGGMTRSTTSNWSLAGKIGSNSDPQGNSNGNGNGLLLNRKALKLVLDQESQAFYLSGTKEIKVKSAQEAQELIRKGQQNRAVFSTLANRVSSRSHGIFTIKIITEHGGGVENPDESIGLSCSTSRLTIVDLAGTERVANTGTTSGGMDQEGRLNEAKSINRSLFGLGNCLQVLRENQQLALNSLNNNNEVRKINGKPGIVPFRASQLTKMLQPFLTGNEAGRAVFILNLNPWDTGFNENTESLKFSATAQEVKVNTNLNLINKNQQQLLISSSNANKRERLNSTSTINTSNSNSSSSGKGSSEIKKNSNGIGNGRDKQVQTEKNFVNKNLEEINEGDITIIEVSDSEDEDGGEEEHDLADYLIQQNDELRRLLYDAQMQCARIESQVRIQMANEMDEQLQEMERMYNERALNDAEQHELLANKKLDLLSKINLSQQTPRAHVSKNLEIESDEEVEDDEEGEDEEEVENGLLALPSSPLRLSDLVINGPSQSTSPSELVGKRHPLASSSSDSPAESSEIILRPGRTSAPDTSAAKRAARHSVEADETLEEESEEEEEDDDDDELSQDEESHSESQETSSEVSESESADEQSEDEQDSEQEVGTESSEAQVNEKEEAEDEAPTPQPVRASTRATRSRMTPSSTSSNLEEPETLTKSRPTRKAAVVANAKNSSTSKGKEIVKKGKKVGAVNALKERVQMEEDPSDTSIIAQPNKEKKKRVLRSKKAVDEETMLDSLADSSLVAQIKKSNSSKRIASNSNNQRLR